MKKCISFLLFATTIVFHFYGAAVGDLFTINSVTYRIISTDEMTVALHKSTLQGDVTFPSHVTDSVNITWTVTHVDQHFYYGDDGLVSVTLPNTIKDLDRLPFRECSTLETINIPASVEYLTELCFNCINLKAINVDNNNSHYCSENGVLYDKNKTVLYQYPGGTSTTDFSIPNGILEIARIAFFGAKNLKSVTLPASTVTIGYQPWANCTSLANFIVNSNNPKFQAIDGLLVEKANSRLVSFPGGKENNYTVPSGIKIIGTAAFYRVYSTKNVTLPNTVEEIEDEAFRTSYITTVNIPKSVRKIGVNPFANCRITAFTIDSNNPYFSVDDGVLFNKNKTELISFPPRRTGNYTIPEGCKVIKQHAFDVAHIEDVTIASSVETIEEYAFYDNNYLKNLTIKQNSNLKTLEYRCLSELRGLETISPLPASIDTIASNVFEADYMLKSIVFEDGFKVKYIPKNMFFGCSAMEIVDFGQDNIFESIGNYAFFNCESLTHVTLPIGLKKMGISAFNGCLNLSQIDFAGVPQVELLDTAVFQNTAISNFIIPESVKTISASAFNSCHNLKTVNIPSTTTVVDPTSFLFCSQLKSINVDKENEIYSSIDGMLASKDKKTLMIFPAGKANHYITLLSPSFERIGDYAFYYCKQLENVTLPKKMNYIGKHAFDLCENLNSIAFLTDEPINSDNIDPTAFYEPNMDVSKIGRYIREGQELQYEENEFWNKFGPITTSFKANYDDGKYDEYFPMSSTGASLLKSTRDDYTLVVPAQVSSTRNENSYTVAMIGDYALSDAPNDVKEVVLRGPIQYVGAKAFRNNDNGTPSINNIFFINKDTEAELSTVRFELDDAGTDDYNEFSPEQNIYVRRSALERFKIEWQKYESQIDDKIPLPDIETYVSFGREFDTDFSEICDDNSKTLTVFTNGTYNNPPLSDEKYYIRMYEIFKGQDGEGTYVPTETGVILLSRNGPLQPYNKSTGEGAYYLIGEKDLNAYSGETIMKPLVIRHPQIVEEVNEYSRIYVENGTPHLIKGSKSLDIHTAYLEIDPQDLDDKDIILIFDDFPTSINDIYYPVNSEEDIYYNLNGQRIDHPSSPGIYLHNGKKIVIRN